MYVNPNHAKTKTEETSRDKDTQDNKTKQNNEKIRKTTQDKTSETLNSTSSDDELFNLRGTENNTKTISQSELTM